MEGKQLLVERQASLSGHGQSIYALAAGPTPGQVFSTGGDGQVVSWQLHDPEAPGRVIARLGNSCYALCHVPERNLLAIAENTQGIHFIDLETRQEVGNVGIQAPGIFAIVYAFGRYYVGDSLGRLTIIDGETFQTIYQVALGTQSVRCLAAWPDRNLLAADMSDNTVRLLDSDGREVHRLADHTQSVFAVAFSPDFSLFVSAGRDAHLRFYDAQAHFLPLAHVPAHLYAINSLAFSPTGQWLVTGSMDKTLKVWDAHRFRLLKVIDRPRHGGHANSVNAVLWLPFNHQIVSGSDDRTLAAWKLSLSMPYEDYTTRYPAENL